MELECRRQVAAIVGVGGRDMDHKFSAVVEVYPPSNTSTLPGLPRDYRMGSTGYISGGLHYCGGYDNLVPFVATSSCYRLTTTLQWKETFPLLKVTLHKHGLAQGGIQLFKRVKV